MKGTIQKTIKPLSRLAGVLLLAAFAVSCKPNVDTPKTVKEITLTFNLAGGTIDGKTDSVTVKGKYEATVTKPANPKKDGYTFSGWNPELPEKFPAENATYTAQWAKLHPVTFKAAALTATLDGKTIGTGAMVAEGKTVVFTAKDDEYAVENWIVTPTDALIAGGKPGESTAKVKITAATTVKVTFSPYKKVTFEKLDDYLKTANAASDGIYYIEVTGLTASDVKGVDWSNPSPLGMILKSNESKKLALKLGAIAGLTDMSGCFSGCKSLTQAPVIPNSVTNMSGCFSGCESLTQAPVIPNSVTNMSSCFSSCESLTQVPVIPNSVTNMSSCFSSCKSLVQAPVIPNGVTDMGGCFSGCERLTQAPEIPNGVTNMKNCFYGCTNLVQAPEIPNSVTDMSDCFYDCISLVQAPEIPNGVTNMSCCFSGCKSLVQAPVIPNGVTDMGGCFDGCKSLVQAPEIPNGVTYMKNCFYGCTNLVQAPEIPNSVTDMSGCFSGCKSLTQAPEIPNSVTYMSGCFSGCTSLTSVTLKCNYPSSNPDAFKNAFGGCGSLIANSIKVPADQLSAYQGGASTMGTTADRFVADN